MSAGSSRTHDSLSGRGEKVKKGLIFDIKRYAIHDGPGIRTTVFFKGCPLCCQWCHNPEGQVLEREIVWYETRCPEECYTCLSSCAREAIQKREGVVRIDEAKCDLCGECQEECAYEAIEIIGKEVSLQDVMKEVDKDRIFYEDSGGGVTFSGGEPLMQPEFLEALVEGCLKKNIPVTVDTCGYASSDIIDKIGEKVPLFLYDLKIIDEERHKMYTGTSNKIILKNLRALTMKGKDIVVRIPLIEGINDDEENIRQTAEFLLSLKGVKNIHLLPFHKGGLEKYRRLRRKPPSSAFQPTSPEKTERIKRMLEGFGFSVKVGG